MADQPAITNPRRVRSIMHVTRHKWREHINDSLSAGLFGHLHLLDQPGIWRAPPIRLIAEIHGTSNKSPCLTRHPAAVVDAKDGHLRHCK